MDGNLLHILASASELALAVLLLLVAMSAMSWAIIFMMSRRLAAARRGIRQLRLCMQDAGSLEKALQDIDLHAGPAFKDMAELGVEELSRLARSGHADTLADDNIGAVLHHAAAGEMQRLSRPLALLAVAASSAPFIGLFGTVWGIMHSFHAIGMMQSASLATVAPGISEALIATAVGLGVAIPAGMAFNLFQSRIESIETEYERCAALLLNRIRHEARANPDAVTLCRDAGPRQVYS